MLFTWGPDRVWPGFICAQVPQDCGCTLVSMAPKNEPGVYWVGLKKVKLKPFNKKMKYGKT